MCFSLIFTALILLTTTIYLYYRYKFSYWSRNKFNQLPPAIPWGNMPNPFTSTKHFALAMTEMYKKMRAKKWRHAGIYIFSSPIYMPIDLECVKLVMQNDFQHFMDRGIYYNERDDPISAHLVNLEGTKWKNLRAKLTPTFTSGKMRTMFPILVECLAPLYQSLDRQMLTNRSIDIKEVLACFTTDIIGGAAFGLEFDAFKDDNSPFRYYGRKVFQMGKFGLLKRRWTNSFPSLARWLGVLVVPKDISAFFMNVVRDTVKQREETNSTRSDFLQLLIDLKNNSNEPITFEEMTAQAFVFFLAGFETSSTTMTFALYELAKNPEIQVRARDEIRKVLAKSNGKFTYESINEMKYLTQCIEEALRKYPPITILPRICVQNYKHPFEDDLVIEKGTRLQIPVYAIHHDEEYYPNPEKYDPDRFSQENKAKMHPCSYLPFGEGPRVCIGLRFGMMQSKVGLAALLNRYEFSVDGAKTVEPLEFDASSSVLSVKGNLWLNVKKLG